MQEQARLRRERRNAKIQAGGSARLQAITQLSGRAAPAPPSDVEQDGISTPSRPQTIETNADVGNSSSRPVSSVHAPDPEEVDISRQLLEQRLGATPSSNDNSSNQAGSGQSDDLMAQMLQQMLGGAGLGVNTKDKSFPPGIADFLSGMNAEQGQPQGQSQRSTAYLWRIVHAVFSLSLALYVALFASAFNGSKLQRTQLRLVSDELDSPTAHSSFWTLFAAAELALQVSRYFIERGQLPPSGLAGGLAGLLPEPWGGYVRVLGRYGVIYSTIVADAMVVVFVLGCISWLKAGSEGATV